MSALLMKNNLEKDIILDKLAQNRHSYNRDNNIEAQKVIQIAKEGIEKLYQKMSKENKKMIHILEMKKKVSEVLNSI